MQLLVFRLLFKGNGHSSGNNLCESLQPLLSLPAFINTRTPTVLSVHSIVCTRTRTCNSQSQSWLALCSRHFGFKSRQRLWLWDRSSKSVRFPWTSSLRWTLSASLQPSYTVILVYFKPHHLCFQVNRRSIKHKPSQIWTQPLHGIVILLWQHIRKFNETMSQRQRRAKPTITSRIVIGGSLVIIQRAEKHHGIKKTPSDSSGSKNPAETQHLKAICSSKST